MKQFANEFNFKGLPLVTALRTFFQAFRLPGEAQQIDQIVQVGHHALKPRLRACQHVLF